MALNNGEAVREMSSGKAARCGSAQAQRLWSSAAEGTGSSREDHRVGMCGTPMEGRAARGGNRVHRRHDAASGAGITDGAERRAPGGLLARPWFS